MTEAPVEASRHPRIPTVETETVRRALSATAAAGAACVAYGVLIERRWYRLARIEVPGVLRAAGRLTILHVSDVHLVPGQDHRVRFLAGLADEDYDLVVATGDLVGALDAESAAVDAVAPLTSRDRPGLVVLGSNDWYAPVLKSPLAYLTDPQRRSHGAPLDTDRLIDRLARHGYHTLRDATLRLPTSAGTIAIAGLDDPHLDPQTLPDAQTLRIDDGDGSEVLRLGLVHSPYLAALDVLVDAGSDLLLAGHTHGGQVRLPGIGALVDNCDLPLDQARGLSRHRGRPLHVSVGLGHSRYAPFRFACRPEATLLTLS